MNENSSEKNIREAKNTAYWVETLLVLSALGAVAGVIARFRLGSELSGVPGELIGRTLITSLCGLGGSIGGGLIAFYSSERWYSRIGASVIGLAVGWGFGLLGAEIWIGLFRFLGLSQYLVRLGTTVGRDSLDLITGGVCVGIVMWFVAVAGHVLSR